VRGKKKEGEKERRKGEGGKKGGKKEKNKESRTPSVNETFGYDLVVSLCLHHGPARMA